MGTSENTINISAKDRPLFSIITVTLNPGSDLPGTIDSVLGQTFNNYEIVIKDGGSTDGSEKIIWDNPRVKRHTSSDNGIFDAMNQALELATGDYVCFLNAGDQLYATDTLSTVAEIIQIHSDVPFFFGDVRKQKSRSGFALYPERLSRYYLFSHVICHQAWFVSRVTYRHYVGFETDYATGGDHRLFLKMIARDKIPYKHVAAIVVTYKGDGVSARPETIAESRKWRQQCKREIFSRWECYVYAGAWALRNMIKRLTYDTLVWRIMRWNRHRSQDI